MKGYKTGAQKLTRDVELFPKKFPEVAMPKRNISNSAILELLTQGKHAAEVARILGVTPACISKRLAKLRLTGATKVLEDDLPVLVGSYVGKIEARLNEINVCLWSELGLIETDLKTATPDLKPHLRLIKLKYVKEARMLVETFFGLLEKVYSIKHIGLFQEEVLELLKRSSPELQRDFIDRLAKRRGFHASLH